MQSIDLYHSLYEWHLYKFSLKFLSWRRQWHPTPVLLPGKSHGWKSLVGCSPWFYLFSSNWDSLVAQSVKNLPAMQKSRRSLGEGNGNPLQYPCLGNSMDRGAWQTTVRGIAGVGHKLAAKPPPKIMFFHMFSSIIKIAKMQTQIIL